MLRGGCTGGCDLLGRVSAAGMAENQQLGLEAQQGSWSPRGGRSKDGCFQNARNLGDERFAITMGEFECMLCRLPSRWRPRAWCGVLRICGDVMPCWRMIRRAQVLTRWRLACSLLAL